MAEKELAAQLQGTKGDPDEWGDATADPDGMNPPVASRAELAPKRRLAAMVSVRLSPEELEAVQTRATERGESVSGYLRGLALRDVSLVTTVFSWPRVFMSSSQPWLSEIATSWMVEDGGRLLTRAS